MRRPVWTRSVRPPKAGRQAAPNSRRDRLAVLLALVTVVCLGSAFFLAKDTQVLQFLMPGPLTSAHSAIENCSACHTKSGSGKLSWMHSLVAGDPLADSKACLTCHKMPDTAFNAHGASAEALTQSTDRLTKIAGETPVPGWARTQSVAFPTNDVVTRGLYCATCHQEHQGGSFNLKKISNEQCHSCHAVKFDSFDGHHPKFAKYPFKRRTRIIYDHAGHFGKHFPEMAKKDPAKRIPPTCSTCHDSRKDKRVMAVAPFEQTCSACHLGQITGRERVSGPKGIAFLALPGLDLQTLQKKNASIGEWPAASEAELTPFMKVMIGRNERGRTLIKTVEALNLQDLTAASDDEIKAVTDLVWEIKKLIYALIFGKASDVLADLNIECGAKLSPQLVADLTASISRDIIISAHQQWLPNLGTEMADRQDASDKEQGCWIATAGGWLTTTAQSRFNVDGEEASIPKPGRLALAGPQKGTKNAPGDAGAKSLRIDPRGRLIKGREDEVEAPKVEAPKAEAPKVEAPKVEAPKAEAPKAEAPKAEAPKAEAAQPGGAAGKAPNAKPGKETLSADARPQAKGADQTDDLLNPTEEELRGIATPGKAAPKAAQREVAPRKADIASAKPGKGTPPADARPQARAADQTDDLLNPTEEELRGVAAPDKDAGKASRPERAAGETDAANAKPDTAAAISKASAETPAVAAVASETGSAKPPTTISPVISIKSDVDPESWAEYGGWYRQDYAIFYRPTGHKDKFIYSWLFLTGPQAPKGDTSPAAAVFDFLTSKDAQGSCTKCHSVDDIQGKGRVVNFSPPSVASKQGRFTTFIHEPHFGVLETRGCLACHSLEKGRPYLQSYEHGNPERFSSNFGAVKKDFCQTCHTRNLARQNCLLCHKYHVNGVITPIMKTKIPTE